MIERPSKSRGGGQEWFEVVRGDQSSRRRVGGVVRSGHGGGCSFVVDPEPAYSPYLPSKQKGI